MIALQEQFAEQRPHAQEPKLISSDLPAAAAVPAITPAAAAAAAALPAASAAAAATTTVSAAYSVLFYASCNQC